MHLFPRFQLSNRCPASSKYTDSSRCPACTFPPIAPLINTSVKWFSSPPLAPLSCFHPLSRLPQTTEPRFYLWQAQATRFFICFSGFWMFFWISWSTFHRLPRFHCSPASSFDQNWEKTLQKMWCGIASIQSGCWFQMRSTEFARSNWWPKSSCFDIWNHLPGSLHSLFKERVSTRPRQCQKSPDQPYQNILPSDAI